MGALNKVKLDLNQRRRAALLIEDIMADPEAAAFEIVCLRDQVLHINLAKAEVRVELPKQEHPNG